MAEPNDPHADVPVSQPPVGQRRRKSAGELDADLMAAIALIERGDYIELTPEQLERCITTGQSPWPDESRG
jgi:hypothetical protein